MRAASAAMSPAAASERCKEAASRMLFGKVFLFKFFSHLVCSLILTSLSSSSTQYTDMRLAAAPLAGRSRRQLHTLLVANRSEIAVRILRAAAELDVRTDRGGGLSARGAGWPGACGAVVP